MLRAVALPWNTLPLALIERHGLDLFLHERGGEKEAQFHFGGADAVLPLRHEGRWLVARWGCGRGESRSLPVGGWTKLATVESGWWAGAGAEVVEVPAALGLDNGVWYAVRQGVRGLYVRDEAGVPRVYVICEPASHYYAIMTRSAWMPVLIGERI
jgi:hypothetical protein